ncbi:uncharacterized protein LOC143568936 [Bidens hawaiensis]|uniref:uncharacterized protein LOC143568936 n=1 Tax=Bidens hawaiensis TaxID=980011 RepID=UPI00404A8CE4
MAEVIVMPVDTVTGDHKADVNVNETTSPPPPPPSRRYDRDYRRTDNRDIDRIPTCRSDYYEHRNRLPHKQRGGHSPPPFKRYRRDDGRRGSPPDRRNHWVLGVLHMKTMTCYYLDSRNC